MGAGDWGQAGPDSDIGPSDDVDTGHDSGPTATHSASRRSPLEAKGQALVTPAVVIVIPAYKHPVFLSEAIVSALQQDFAGGVGVVIVNDGCPYVETHVVGQSFAVADPRVRYVRKPNGGLSSARNFGIEAALAAFPSFQACYFLDADNRLTPNAITDAMAVLDQQQVDWVYPNIDKFGIEWAGDYSPRYSALVHIAFDNICEAGSLVSRRLVDAGVRFDETMKDGFEDWDFWLQALGHGFRGANCPTLGFEYRQRAESMLRGSNRIRQSILARLRKKHKRLFDARNLLALEHVETPRYAMFAADEVVTLFTDPALDPHAVSMDSLGAAFWSSKTESEAEHFPPYLVWCAPEAMPALSAWKLTHWAFWMMESLADDAHLIAIRFEHSDGTIGVDVTRHHTDVLPDDCQMWMVGPDIAQAVISDTSDAWLKSVLGQAPLPKVAVVTVRAPFGEVTPAPSSLLDRVISDLGQLRTSAYRNPKAQRWTWRSKYLPAKGEMPKRVRLELHAGPILPRVITTTRKQIGVVIPIAAFGGVEKVAYNFARVAKSEGFDLNLFIVGRPSCALMDDLVDSFESISFIGKSDVALWGGPHRFMGHELAMEHDPISSAKLFGGLLLGMDMVINCHSALLNAHVGKLRAQGIKTATWLHVLDESQAGRRVGHPYLALAFEHAYDHFITCSHQLADWLTGMGVPRNKVLPVVNAPGYVLDDAERDSVLAARFGTQGKTWLKVLYLGRLDTQKGVERLYEAVRLCKQARLPISWEIVGGEVIAKEASDWGRRFAELQVEFSAPVYHSAGLTAKLASADILLLPSRWEGAPLVILEAQRLGCVPIATNVGAVAEQIDHLHDGVLIDGGSDAEIANQVKSVMTNLAARPEELRRMAQTAAAKAAMNTWERNLNGLLNAMRDALSEPPASTH